MAIWRVKTREEVRLATGPAGVGPQRLLASATDLDELLAGEPGTFTTAALDPGDEPVGPDVEILTPISSQEVWAAGVTYPRSLSARRLESTEPDHYDRVYTGERPELFLKAQSLRSRGPGQTIGVRSDSTWDVPEPELGVLADRHGTIVAYTVGNDVSSRSIEGENPLYLPQAKVYTGSCAVGPSLVPVHEAPDPAEMIITLDILRDGGSAYTESISVATMRRGLNELVEWLFRGQEFPCGVLLLTGTAIVPDAGFSLAPGDRVEISITGLGTLTNHVEAVEAGEPASATGGGHD